MCSSTTPVFYDDVCCPKSETPSTWLTWGEMPGQKACSIPASCDGAFGSVLGEKLVLKACPARIYVTASWDGLLFFCLTPDGGKDSLG